MLRLQSNSDIGLASRSDLERILNTWNDSCTKLGLSLSKQIFNEFSKRINNAATKKTKAKLDLSGSNLDHQMTVLLLEALALKPVIAKLNLVDNQINNETIKLLIRLLKGQCSLMRKIELDDRLNIVFLGEVLIKAQSSIDAQLLYEIKSLTESLFIANVQAHIRTSFLKIFRQSLIDVNVLTKVWTSVVGNKPDKNKLVQIFSTLDMTNKSNMNVFSYQELESIIIQGLIQRGAISTLTEKQLNLLIETAPKHTESSPVKYNSSYGAISPPISQHSFSVSMIETLKKKQLENDLLPLQTNKLLMMSMEDTNSSSADPYSQKVQLKSELQSNYLALIQSAVKTENNPVNMKNEVHDEEDVVQVIIPDSAFSSPITSPQPSSIKTYPTPIVLPIKSSNTPTHYQRSNSKNNTNDLYSTEATNKQPFSPIAVTKNENIDHGKITTIKLSSYISNKSPRKSILDMNDNIESNLESSPTKSNDYKQMANNYNREFENYVQTFDEIHITPTSYDEEFIPPESTYIQYERTLAKLSNKEKNEIFKYSNFEKKLNIDFITLLDNETTSVLKVLVLRNNNISSIDNLTLNRRFPQLTDLDLGYNNMVGALKSCPQTLLRLDLSHNKLTNISAILLCISLQELNLSHNLIKNFHGLPSRLIRLDISHNLIKTISTLRTLALSPLISSIALHHNDISMQGNEWKITLRSILLNLTELDGKILPNTKNSSNNAMVNKINKTKFIEKKNNMITSKDQQQIKDTIRTRQHQIKLITKEENKIKTNEIITNTKKTLLNHPDSSMNDRRKSLRPNEIKELTKRLTVKTTSQLNKQTWNEIKQDEMKKRIISDIPKSFSTYNGSYKSSKLHPSQSFSSNDVDLSSWVSKSKLELKNAVNMIKKSFELSKQNEITTKHVMRFSHSLSLISFYSNQDLPLKVEYAIEKLSLDHPLLIQINEIREHIDRISTFLHKIESAIVLSMKGAFKLSDSLDILMTSDAGLYKNVKLLKQYGYTYDPATTNNVNIDNHIDNYIHKVAEPELYEETKSYFDSYSDDYHIKDIRNNENYDEIENEFKEQSNINIPFSSEINVRDMDEYNYRVISPSQENNIINSSSSNAIIDTVEKSLADENNALLLDRMRNRITMRTIQNITPSKDNSKIDSIDDSSSSNIELLLAQNYLDNQSQSKLIIEESLDSNTDDQIKLNEQLGNISLESHDINTEKTIQIGDLNEEYLINSSSIKNEIYNKVEEIEIITTINNNFNEEGKDIDNIMQKEDKDRNIAKDDHNTNENVNNMINKVEPKLSAKERLQMRLNKSTSEVLSSKPIEAIPEIPNINEKSKSLANAPLDINTTNSSKIDENDNEIPSPSKPTSNIAELRKTYEKSKTLPSTPVKSSNKSNVLSSKNIEQIKESPKNNENSIIENKPEKEVMINEKSYEVIFQKGSLGLTLLKADNEIPVVSKVNDDGQAFFSGIECNDYVTKVGDISVKTYDEATTHILSSPRPLKITFNRTSLSPNYKKSVSTSAINLQGSYGSPSSTTINNTIDQNKIKADTNKNDEKEYDLLSSLKQTKTNTISINENTNDNKILNNTAASSSPVIDSKISAKERLLARMAKNKK